MSLDQTFAGGLLSSIGLKFRDRCWCAQGIEGEVSRSNSDSISALAAILGWGDGAVRDGGV